MAITFCECLSCSMEVKHPRFSFRVRLQGDVNCRDSDHAVPSTVCFWYPQQLRPTIFNINDQKNKNPQKLSDSSRWHFWTKVYALILVQISGWYFLLQKPHTWGRYGLPGAETEAARALVPSAGNSFFWHCCSHGERSQPSLFGNWHLCQRACSTSFTCYWC